MSLSRQCDLVGLVRSGWYYQPVTPDIRLARGFAHLVAILNWFSRYVLSFRLSNTLEAAFCTQALEEALELGSPDIFNTDQGCQFTSDDFTDRLRSQRIQISMDGRGRALRNIFVERLWRSVKYEDVYLKGYQTMSEVQEGLKLYFQFYNNERFHQALNYRTPREVHLSTTLETGRTLTPRKNKGFKIGHFKWSSSFEQRGKIGEVEPK